MNRVYGIEKVFFIDSRNIGSSLEQFRLLTKTQREKFNVIAGHGASMFFEFVEDPFCITILREPVELFISQYRFLKISRGTIYFDEVSKIKSIEDYLDFAQKTGQDNLLTRYLSNSMQFLVDPDTPVPDFDKEGDQLLQKAISNLKAYDAVLNLNHFDKSVFALKEKLKWKSIPVYRPSNINKKNKNQFEIEPEFKDRLKHALRFDIALFEIFNQHKIDIAEKVKINPLKYSLFQTRQSILNSTAKILGKS